MNDAAELSWFGTSAAELASAAGAVDLFVFRRVAENRFAHVGGAGRGAGWAGIVEVEDDEPLIASALSTEGVVRRTDAAATHAFGPYYGQTLAIVTVSPDVFVVFGADGDGGDLADDRSLTELAAYSADALVEVAPAKRLADEVEALSAV
jgi:hypothetical protein